MQTNLSFQAVSRAPRGLRAVRPRDARNNGVSLRKDHLSSSFLVGSLLPLAWQKNKGLLIVYGDMEMKEINLKDEVTTSPNYFCRKGIGTTEMKDLAHWVLKRVPRLKLVCLNLLVWCFVISAFVSNNFLPQGYQSPDR